MLISKTIDDALTMIAVKNPAEEASPEDHEFGLRTLNRIIDAYNAQGLTVTYLQDLEYGPATSTYGVPDCVITADDGTAIVTDATCPTDNLDVPLGSWDNYFTIGPGKMSDTVAPIDIQGAFFRLGAVDFDMKPMTHTQWQEISYKSVTSIPRFYYVQRMDDNSVMIRFDCKPQDGLILHLMAKKPYIGTNGTGTEYVPTDDINWSYGFEKMLMTRLAVELAPSYEVQPSPALIGMAQEAENIVKAKNYVPSVLKTSPGLGKKRSNFSRTNRARY